MYATEFQTIINEPYIKIPNFERFKGHKVRVVLLDLIDTTLPNEEKKIGFIENLINNPKDVPIRKIRDNN
jgi:hypothetical protein